MDLLETNLQPAIRDFSAREVLLLEVIHPFTAEQPLEHFPLVLGRDHSCDVALEAELVSRRHAELNSRGGALVLRDLNSRNGCHVNGAAVNGEQELKAGDADPPRRRPDAAVQPPH